ncbi:Cof-type HAD-IIB family hydrolase [Mesobacillus zeae]|uniref:HAD family phosphatase n=1 Tax=Mesobacillus zeae TaxID=1917180 RepID=A0A398BB75_9BACI|nr:Cof-type HAD-IIB family hydrolase [Mesobacillus zeae]RID86814.1 HAD family phosphatase [Mesobacillus zeae]
MKCIASDMDGTLLTAAQELTPENREAIKRAQAQGIEVVIATGRSYDEAVYVLKKAGLQCPVICVNGAEVRSKEGEVLAVNPLGDRQAEEAAKLLKDSGVYFEVYTNKGTFTDDEDKAVTIIADIISSANPGVPLEKIMKGAEERVRAGLVHKINDYASLFSSPEYQIYKLLAFSFDDGKLSGAQERIRTMEGVEVTSSGSENIEVTSKDAQKGIALEAFVKAKGIALAETMAIGDNYNDVSMLRIAGRSVAMGNASEEIKAICTAVTITNEESGVAKAINEVL